MEDCGKDGAAEDKTKLECNLFSTGCAPRCLSLLLEGADTDEERNWDVTCFL